MEVHGECVSQRLEPVDCEVILGISACDKIVLIEGEDRLWVDGEGFFGRVVDGKVAGDRAGGADAFVLVFAGD